MRYHSLACDYDGTLALHGRVSEETVGALERARASGRRLILVTGRHLPDLLHVFPQVELFERVVAENGALLYRPDTREERALADPPPRAFIEQLRRRGVEPAVGRVIVATWEPHDKTVFDVIRHLGLELQVIFNKGAVMVLPSGVNKATGLRAGLDELNLSAHNVVGVGDAENDHAFLSLCESSVAVANALPVIKDYVDWVTAEDHGKGVIELIEALIASDLRELEPKLSRHRVPLGHVEEKGVSLSPYGANVLLAGQSGAGKSTFATAFAEQLRDRGYQYCIVDPEGDYQHIEDTVVLGDVQRAPSPHEVMELAERPTENIVVNLLGVARDRRPAFFDALLPALLELRARTGRPHWILLDEAHHLLPATWAAPELGLPPDMTGLMLITVHPDHLSRRVLQTIDILIAVGSAPEHSVKGFCAGLNRRTPRIPPRSSEREILAWRQHDRHGPFWMRPIEPRSERRRHIRKYAQGELGADKSFYFRGPQGKLNLRAHNLMLFVQLAEGVDEETWLHHLRRGDYSRWFGEAIKDKDLAEATARIESDTGLAAHESRARVRAAIEERYTQPA